MVEKNEVIIAVDLGGTLLRVALVENNKIKKIIKKDTPKNKERLKKELQDSVSEIIDFSKSEIKGIGVSSAGPLKNGVITNPPNLNFKKFDLKKALKKFKLETIIENDANCAALAEAKLGIKKENFVVLTLGTGIGGGIIINNELYKGKGNAGEIGHMILDKGKDFEKLAAGRRIKKMSKKIYGKELLVKELLDKKDKKSNEILNEVSIYLGQGIASVINIFDPDAVVLAGGFREAGNNFLKEIKKEAKNKVKNLNRVDIKWSKLDEPGILGASLLVK